MSTFPTATPTPGPDETFGGRAFAPREDGTIVGVGVVLGIMAFGFFGLKPAIIVGAGALSRADGEAVLAAAAAVAARGATAPGAARCSWSTTST